MTPTPGPTFVLDDHGHLMDWTVWTAEFAQEQAHGQGIVLQAEHWQLIELLRTHYAQFRDTPPMRLLTRLVSTQLGPELGNSRSLYRLFPDSPLRQASLLAGLPKPRSCI